MRAYAFMFPNHISVRRRIHPYGLILCAQGDHGMVSKVYAMTRGPCAHTRHAVRGIDPRRGAGVLGSGLY